MVCKTSSVDRGIKDISHTMTKFVHSVQSLTLNIVFRPDQIDLVLHGSGGAFKKIVWVEGLVTFMMS